MSLELAISTHLDSIVYVAMARNDVALELQTEASTLCYRLGLHRAEQQEDTDIVETQLRRRLFWGIYTSDKTSAMDINKPTRVHDSEGTPPFPLEANDENMAHWGNSAETSGPKQTSYMVGFNALSKIFQVLSGCQLRSRTFKHSPSDSAGIEELVECINTADLRLDEIYNDLPADLKYNRRRRARDSEPFEEKDIIFGIEQANLCITMLCVKFALLDFKAHLQPGNDTRAKRIALAHAAYAQLSGIPIEHLAMNGESMRGKVLRVVIDLLAISSDEPYFVQGVWDWWNMYSTVQFLQFFPAPTQE